MNWYRELQGNERKTLWSCFLGWALDGMDVQIYTFLIPALTAAWGLSKGDAGLLQTVALLTSALGGWIAGHARRPHRPRRMLQITILWFAVFTALSGLTQSFDQLLIVRSLQGLGFGGEWAAGSVLIGEVVRTRFRGSAVGFVQSGWAPGWAVAAIAASLALAYLPAEWPGARCSSSASCRRYSFSSCEGLSANRKSMLWPKNARAPEKTRAA